MDLSKLLNGEHWFNPNPGPPSMAYSVLAFLFAVLLGAGIYLYVYKKRLFGQHKLKLRLASQVSTIALALGLLGLVLVACRFLLVPYLSSRFLIYLVLIALGIAVIYYVYYFLRVFPSRLAAYNAAAMRRRYLPSPGPSAKKRRKKRR